MKIGFVGAGGIAQVHAACLRQGVPEVELVGVADIFPGRAEAFVREFGGRAFTRGADLLDLDLDAVFVLTNPRAHGPCVVEALAAGKHVFCEKPLTATYEEGLELARAVEASDRVFMLGYVFHYSRSAQRIKALLDAGDLGELAVAWSQRFAYHRPAPDHWHSDPVEGSILDLCTHDIEFLCWWGGRPEAVQATAATGHPGGGFADTVSINLTFKRGMGTVLSSWASLEPVMNIGVSGTRGSAVLSAREGGAIALRVALEGKEAYEEAPEDQMGVMVAEQRAFLEAVQAGRKASPGVAEGLLALQVQEAAQRSWRDGGRVRLAPAAATV